MLSLIASLFTLDQVIAFLTAGIVLIQGVAQVVALFLLRRRKIAAPFRMPLYPLPAIVALAGWSLAFASSGTAAIALGLGWLAVGGVVFLIAARKERWWPFLALLAISLVLPAPVLSESSAPSWLTWNTSRVTAERGYPVFAVDGKPFFVYGAAFFYERIPRERWRATLAAYKNLGINTIDLYLIWNWHEPSEDVYDFTGTTNPRRDLLGLLKLTHELGFKLILRPGPVIRNEWRNGGYPAWLLQRPQYNMPLHDALEGRYPATATLQNAHADAAGAEWLANAQHLSYAGQWLTAVLHSVEPYSRDVIAVALDDDQGAYLDNDTWPAPHWHAYVDWLRQTVASVVGTRVPLFINTYEMKVPSASPAWAWGNWYQSDAYRIGEHDLSNLDFATGLLQTQSRFPVMQSEFQAGWLQGADEGAPRPSDPANTALALTELLRDGAHGLVNFPVQDTIAPHGWEAPWANWSYAWDAALTVDLHASSRYAPTRAIGDLIRRYGSALAKTHVVADASIVWPPSLFAPGSLSNGDFTALADATIAMQRSCNAHGLTCTLIDLAADRDGSAFSRDLLLPLLPSDALMRRMQPSAVARLAELRRSGRLAFDASSVHVSEDFRKTSGVTVLLADDRSYGFVVAINASGVRRHIGPMRVRLANRTVRVAAFDLSARSTRIVPFGIFAPAPAGAPVARLGNPPPFRDPDGTSIGNAHLQVVFAPFAGARIAELGDGPANAATSIGLLRDAIDPEPQASSRDYIAAYTHPVAAGTFNRSYACSRGDALTTARIICSYDAPDLPQGGALFTRRLMLAGGSDELLVDEEFTPHDPRSTARLQSISGFTFTAGDALLTSSGGDALGILHGRQLTTLRWRHGDVARVDLRAARGAELVTLTFARRSVAMRVGVRPVQNAAEAQRLLDANQP
jgi:hypothetical protein